jgi:dihydroorotate dehydrogenase (fumarate)
MDITTKYMGLKLKNPLIVSSSRLSEKIDNINKMAAAGASAIIMYSIFEEEINYEDDFVDYFSHRGEESFPEALTYFPHYENQGTFLTEHLLHLEKSVKAVDIPIIGSLNAVSEHGWLDYALKMEATGIAGIELNLNPFANDRISSSAIEEKYLAIIAKAKKSLKIPLAVKLPQFFTSIPYIVNKLDEIGVDGIVIFNRFFYPDFNVKTMDLETSMYLSSPDEIRLRLRWVALLANKLKKSSIAGSTAIYSGRDLVKYILAGANAATITSCILKNGIPYISTILDELQSWMKDNSYQTIESFRGKMSHDKVEYPEKLDRANYMKALRTYPIMA